ncbi:MAG: SlyX family protein [Proteobacteria bacterium]|nr:SlyX family protein [Pseudomonadota bacterium]MBS0572674.1 SlyX family protein [Pseudomonadota bacterium]
MDNGPQTDGPAPSGGRGPGRRGTRVEKRLEALEEEVAHLRRATDDLSEVVVRQAREIDLLTRRVAMLTERAAEAEALAGGAIPLADQKPPHW